MKSRIFYSSLLLTGVNLLLRLISTSFQVYLSGKIGPEGIGLLHLLLSVGGLAMIAGAAGVRTSAMYLTAEELGKGRKRNVHWVLSGCTLYSLVFSVTVSMGLYCFAPVIAESWIGEPEIFPAIRIFALFLPVNCLCGVMTGYFTAANRIRTLAAVEVAEQLTFMGTVFSLLTLWAGSDPLRACIAVVVGQGLGSCFTLACLWVLRLRERTAAGPRIPIAGRLLKIALPLAAADDLKAGISTGENLMVPKRLALYEGTQSPLAAFGMVCGMVFPIMMFPAAILFGLSELLVPELARCAAVGSRKRISYLVGRCLHVGLLYGCACAGVIFLTADGLCGAIYHTGAPAPYLKAFALLIPMLYADSLIDAMTKGLGQQTACVRYNILTSAMDVGLLFVLLPRFGLHGYFCSFFVTHFINFCLSLRRLCPICHPAAFDLAGRCRFHGRGGSGGQSPGAGFWVSWYLFLPFVPAGGSEEGGFSMGKGPGAWQIKIRQDLGRFPLILPGFITSLTTPGPAPEFPGQWGKEDSRPPGHPPQSGQGMWSGSFCACR